MNKKLIGAALLGLTVVASVPAFAQSNSSAAEEIRSQGGVVSAFILPSEQLRQERQRNR